MKTDYINRLVSYLKDEFELDQAEAHEALTHYTSNIKDLIIKADSSISRNDWDSLRHAAHSLKGVSANIGDRIMCTHSIDLESSAVKPVRNDTEIILQTIKEHFRKIEIEFNEKYKS